MPLPENNILFYWTAPDSAPFSFCGEFTKTSPISAAFHGMMKITDYS